MGRRPRRTGVRFPQAPDPSPQPPTSLCRPGLLSLQHPLWAPSLIRSLLYHWRLHLAVVAGSAVAAAVLTGALLVGDSVRGSLLDLTLQRLGRIDSAVLADRFFSQDLAREVEASPHILLSGNASTASEDARARDVQILGVDSTFADLYSEAPDLLGALEGAEGFFPPVVINRSLRDELNVEVGDAILLAYEDPADVHRDFLLGSRDPTDLLQTRRVQVAGVVPDSGVGRFGLKPYQAAPRNAFMRLSDLQKALDRPNRANAAFVPLASDRDTAAVAAALGSAVTLDDLSLSLRRSGAHFVLESPRYYLSDPSVEAARRAANRLGLRTAKSLTYLANDITFEERAVPYSTVCALDPNGWPEDGGFQMRDGGPVPDLGDTDILLNAWTAEDLGASVGDSIRISFYQPEAAGKLVTRTSAWVVRGVVAMSGPGADPDLTPEFPGIEGADDMASWDAPFPIDLGRIRPEDEAYWDRYRAAPKAFVSLESGRRLWSSRFGSTTSVRFSLDGQDVPLEELRNTLLERLHPRDHGFVVAPLRSEGVHAAEGATDFSGLFIGFSFFLIISASLLVALLFRLGVETRAGEVGLLLAFGYPPRVVRRRFLKEGAVLAVAGSLPGLALGVGYAHLMILGLTTWWKDAVGTSHLSVHVEPQSLGIGLALSLVVILFTILRSLRQLRERSVRSLLSKSTALPSRSSARRARWTSAVSLVLAVALLSITQLSGGTADPGLFFGSAALLLIAGLGGFSVWLRAVPDARLPRAAVALRMGIRNTRRRPGRSLLCATLIGFACFVIVAVGANRKPPASAEETLDPDSGTGGYNLIATTDVPLYQDLTSADDRAQLGFSPEDGEAVDAAVLQAFAVRSGDDASCLNLYRPQNPTVLGAPDAFVDRGGFRFAGVLEDPDGVPDASWRILYRETGDPLPAVGDANSMQWILHLGLGDELTVSGPEGGDVPLLMAGMLQSSIFQSELLVSEERFRQAFPGAGGYRMFLIRTEPDRQDQMVELLESNLGRFGMDVVPTADRLSTFSAVENTYLSTFQTVGGLGLLLGTIGLGILLFRNVLERTGELAALRAFGYRQAVLRRMLLAENGFLLAVGIGIGAVAALLAVAPHVAAGHSIPWGSLAATMVVVFVVGLCASAVAASAAMRRPLIPALKEER